MQLLNHIDQSKVEFPLEIPGFFGTATLCNDPLMFIFLLLVLSGEGDSLFLPGNF